MVDHLNKKPRILLLSTAYLPLVGGSELAIRNLTDRMQGYEFDMVTGRYGADMPETEQVGRVRVYRVGGALTARLFLVPKAFLPLAIFFKARRLAKQNDYALVHAYQASQAAGAAWLLSFIVPSMPRLVTVQEGKNLNEQDALIRMFRRWILRRANAVTVISAYLRDAVKQLTDVPTHIIPNGVALERFTQRPDIAVMKDAHEHMGTGPHHRVIVSVSRLVPKNGLANLIRALALVRQEIVHDEPVLVLIGTGPLEEELKHLSLLEGVSDSVKFIGHVEHGRLPAYLHAAHVFARPSLSEGMGSAFLEAMAAGTPVVASRVGGIADFLEEGATGFVCDPNEPVSIADALIRALKGDDSVKTIVDRARRMVQEKYDWNIIARSMEKVYEEITR